MKNPTIPILLLLMLFPTFSCHRNRLKTSEKELAKEILTQENENKEAERIALEKQLADTLNQPKKGVLFKEDRSVDPACPPVIIDIAGSLNNIKEFKLSDVVSEIRYVRLETVPDSTFSRAMKFKYYLFSNYIIATNPCGILHYSKDGKFINIIVKNKTTGINVDADWMQVMGVNTFIGGGTSVWAIGDSLFYTYRNSITGQEYIMGYDLSKKQISPSKQYEPENPDQIIGLGEIALDMNPAKRKPVWKYKLSPELVSWAMPYEYIYQSIGTFYLDKNTYAKELERTDKIAVINNKGDTLTAFTRFEEGNSLRFEFGGKQFLWNGLNDTVFQVVGSNRIIPVIVLNLGQYKASLKQVRQIGFDLTGKIIPRHFAENRNFIFLIFSKNAYDSQNNRKNKKVQIYHALFLKQNHQLFIIKGDPYNYFPEILENNLDGSIPVWPLSYMIGNNGEILIPLKGKELKDRITSEHFKLSAAPVAKKNELKQLASMVSDTEDILMIVK
ncbi:MAG: DUF4933 domain-containing protein [Bacteroidales bacterium]|nr:DUF4933 domain-containing protein [Bacteroidales bacterium]